MKGILFKPDMIKAIVEGGKTVTRRVVQSKCEDFHRVMKYVYPVRQGGFSFQDFPSPSGVVEAIDKTGKMPRYEVGEAVYIKEAWAVDKAWDDAKPSWINPDICAYYKGEDNLPAWVGKWRSPLFMPAWAARYFIQITDVRAERLQEITEEDCLKEGIEPFHSDLVHLDLLPIQKYQRLWDSINPKYPWASNPWCFVYTFEVGSPTKERG